MDDTDEIWHLFPPSCFSRSGAPGGGGGAHPDSSSGPSQRPILPPPPVVSASPTFTTAANFLSSYAVTGAAPRRKAPDMPFKPPLAKKTRTEDPPSGEGGLGLAHGRGGGRGDGAGVWRDEEDLSLYQDGDLGGGDAKLQRRLSAPLGEAQEQEVVDLTVSPGHDQEHGLRLADQAPLASPPAAPRPSFSFRPPAPRPPCPPPAAKRGLQFSSQFSRPAWNEDPAFVTPSQDIRSDGGGFGTQESSLNLTEYIDFQVDRQLENDKEAEDIEQAIEEFGEDDFAEDPATPARPQGLPEPPPLTIPRFTPGGTADGTVRLIPTSSVPERYRGVFAEFSHFNIVQSEAFGDLMGSTSCGGGGGSCEAVVVSAPTGSGKTVAFELAMVRALMEREAEAEDGIGVRPSKMVYLSPMKSLCAERTRDWKAKFGSLGVRTLELTGDSSASDVMAIRDFDLVVTTPEKWDVVTRRWKDHKEVARAVGLVMIDEVHLLNDKARGHTLEAIVSRMKTISKTSENSPRLKKNLRFVAVSATIPNAEDIATWLGGGKAVTHKFGEERRPVKLRKVVLGYHHREGTSEFKFEMNLTYKLGSLVATYSDNKPTLIFCSSRKSSQFTATTVAKEANLQMAWNQRQSLQEIANHTKDQKLADCLAKGVGFHHAGLDQSDRRTVEELFVSGDLPILVSTSTLAMGVNLPAHLVVIKGTGQMISGTYQEYNESQVLQMIGRAGRPQFDTSATAVIMTTDGHKSRYESLVNGTQKVESYLHENLVEHLNAEIVLSTIADIGVALDWLRSTFYSVRATKNPRHYGLPADLTTEQLERRMQDLCVVNLNALAQIKLIEMTAEIDVKPTKAGQLMARYYVAFDTMKNFASIEGQEELSTLLNLLCKSKEFEDIPLRRGEKTLLNTLNKDKHKATIRFPWEGKVKDKNMKTSILMQASLGCLHIADPALQRESLRIVQIGDRLAKCLVEYLWALDDETGSYFKALRSAFFLAKSLSCGIWNNSSYVSKQFERVGIAYSTSLVHAGFGSFRALREADPRQLELALNKPPPFGNHLRNSAAAMPEYQVDLQQECDPGRTAGGRKPRLKVTVTIKNCDIVRERSTAGKYHTCVLLVGGVRNRTELKVKVKDSQILNSGRYERSIPVEVSSGFPRVPVRVAWISERYAGLDVARNFTLELRGVGGGGARLRSERLSDLSMAEFLNGDADLEEEEEGAREENPSEESVLETTKASKGRRVPESRENNLKEKEPPKLSPNSVREMQKDWFPVTPYLGKQPTNGGLKKSKAQQQPKVELRLSPASIREMQKDWSPVSQYMCKQTKVVKTTMTTTTTTTEVVKKNDRPVPAVPNRRLLPPPKPQLEVAKSVQHKEYKIEYVEQKGKIKTSTAAKRAPEKPIPSAASPPPPPPPPQCGEGVTIEELADEEEGCSEPSLPSPIAPPPPPAAGEPIVQEPADFPEEDRMQGPPASSSSQFIRGGTLSHNPKPDFGALQRQRYLEALSQQRGAGPASSSTGGGRLSYRSVSAAGASCQGGGFQYVEQDEVLDLSISGRSRSDPRPPPPPPPPPPPQQHQSAAAAPTVEKVFDFSQERLAFGHTGGHSAPYSGCVAKVDVAKRQELARNQDQNDKKMLSSALRDFLVNNNLSRPDVDEERTRKRTLFGLSHQLQDEDRRHPVERNPFSHSTSPAQTPANARQAMSPSVASQFQVARRQQRENPFRRNSKLREFWADD